jgi:carbon storage regulator
MLWMPTHAAGATALGTRRFHVHRPSRADRQPLTTALGSVPTQAPQPWRELHASIDLRKEPTMLVLSRHRDESIMIGDDIVVTIVDIRGDKVRLGIEAPSDIPVHRQEVYEAIQRENRKASQLKPDDTRDLGRPNPSGK